MPYITRQIQKKRKIYYLFIIIIIIYYYCNTVVMGMYRNYFFITCANIEFFTIQQKR